MDRDRSTLQEAREDAERYYQRQHARRASGPEGNGRPQEPPASGPAATSDGPAGHYAPGEGRPLSGYAALSSIFAVSLTGALVAVRLSGRELPERIGPGDILATGIAAHKLSRLIAKDKVASFFRAPFTRFQELAGHGEVEEEAYGDGLRRAIGELLVCPYCLGMWAASGLTIGLIAAPRQTRLISSVLVVDTVSDFMQIVYRAAERAA